MSPGSHSLAFGSAAVTILLIDPAAPLSISTVAPDAWLAILSLTLISTLGGFGFYTRGLKYLSTSSASITATLEPLMATVLAFVLLGELLKPVQMIGGILIIVAVILLALRAREKTKGQSTEGLSVKLPT